MRDEAGRPGGRRERAAHFTWLVASGILAFFAAAVTVGVVLAFLGAVPGLPGLVIAGTLTLTWLAFGARRFFPDRALPAFSAAAAAVLVLVLLCGLASAALPDFSSDGIWYHQTSISEIAEGWRFLSDRGEGEREFWMVYYPKGPWILAAAVQNGTGGVEVAKLGSPLLFWASLGCVLSALLLTTRLKPAWVAALGLVAACNPVTLLEMPTFMVDGQLASALLITVSLTALALHTGSRWVLASLGFGLVYAVNIKLSASAYLVVLGGGVLLIAPLAGRRLLRHSRAVVVVAVLALGVGAFLAGFNPYTQNLLARGDPVYPVGRQFEYRGRTMDFASSASVARPPEWEGFGRGRRLVASLFSESRLAREGRLRLPFAARSREWKEFCWGGEVRAGGFGPWFSGAVVLALGVVVAGLFHLRSVTVRLGLAFLLVVLGSVLLNPVCWWARLAPQFWLIPVAAAGMALYLRWVGRALGILLLLVLIVNTAGVSVIQFASVVRESRKLEATLDRLAEGEQPVSYWLAGDRTEARFGCLRWFERRGIRLKRVEAPGAGESIPIVRTLMRVVVEDRDR